MYLNRCYNKCSSTPDITYASGFFCLKCDVTCATCNGSTVSNCLSCVTGKLY
jgi:hypothetical protein